MSLWKFQTTLAQRVDPEPVAAGLTTPLGLDVAPPGFGDYAGQIFVTDVGDIQVPVPQTQALKRDGKSIA